MKKNIAGWLFFALLPWYLFVGLFFWNANYVEMLFIHRGPVAWYGFGMLAAVFLLSLFTFLCGLNRESGKGAFFVAALIGSVFNLVGMVLILIGPAVISMIEMINSPPKS